MPNGREYLDLLHQAAVVYQQRLADRTFIFYCADTKNNSFVSYPKKNPNFLIASFAENHFRHLTGIQLLSKAEKFAKNKNLFTNQNAGAFYLSCLHYKLTNSQKNHYAHQIDEQLKACRIYEEQFIHDKLMNIIHNRCINNGSLYMGMFSPELTKYTTGKHSNFKTSIVIGDKHCYGFTIPKIEGGIIAVPNTTISLSINDITDSYSRHRITCIASGKTNKDTSKDLFCNRLEYIDKEQGSIMSIMHKNVIAFLEPKIKDRILRREKSPTYNPVYNPTTTWEIDM